MRQSSGLYISYLGDITSERIKVAIIAGRNINKKTLFSTYSTEAPVVVMPFDLLIEYTPTPKKQNTATIPPIASEYKPISFHIDPVTFPPLSEIRPAPNVATMIEIEPIFLRMR